MLVDFRPHARLRGKNPVDITAAVTPVLDALREDAADLDRVRVVCDWVQYRENFRDVVDVRPVVGRPGRDELEIAVDVRRSAGVPLQELTAARLRGDEAGRVFLDDWGPGSESCIWDFNGLYWNALGFWEKATGHGVRAGPARRGERRAQPQRGRRPDR